MSKYIKDLDYELKDQKRVYSGKRIKVNELTYYNPRDNKYIYREHVNAREAAVILAIDDNNDVIMIQEPRTPIGKIILSLPAGMIEENEEPKKRALRELREETGYIPDNIKLLRYSYPSIGYSSERAHVFLATGLTLQERDLDDTEDIKVIKISLKKLKVMLDNNEIIDTQTNLALLHFFVYEYDPKIYGEI